MWFLGNASSPAIRTGMRHGELGMIITPAEGRAPLDDVVFGADNGCYGSGYPGDQRWLSWLAQWTRYADRCLWASAPDVVGDAAATLARSRPFLPRIRQLGLPAALVAQEGAEHLRLPWEEFDVLFLGGLTAAWKLGPAAAELVAEARRRGKPVHMGRVNSQKRWNYAHSLGCTSVDGTCLTFAPDLNLVRVRRWIASTTPTPAPAPPAAHRGNESDMALAIVPVTFRQTREFIREHHRHHRPPQGMKFVLGVAADDKLVGVAVVGRPVARHLDDKATLEVTRTCTDGTRNANSLLYATAWRITRELGYTRLISYTEAGESGASLRAAGFRPVAHRRGHRGWNRPSRPRTDSARPVARTRWELRRSAGAPAPDRVHSGQTGPGRDEATPATAATATRPSRRREHRRPHHQESSR